MPISTAVHQVARLAPDRGAVVSGSDRMTYRQLASDVDRVTAALVREGFEPGARIGIRVQHTYAQWVLLLAGLRLGAATVAHGPDVERELGIIGGVDALVTSEKALLAPTGMERRIELAALWASAGGDAGLAPTLPTPAAAERTLARIFLSSGTTGVARAIRIDAQALTNRAVNSREAYGFTPESLSLSGIGPDTIGGFQVVFVTWASAGCVVLPPSRATLSDTVNLHRPNFIMVAPSRLHELVERVDIPDEARERCRVATVGAVLPAALRARALERVCGSILLVYGSTEVGVVATGDSSTIERHPGSIGYARPGAEIEIVDEDGAPVPSGQEGELRVRSNGMVRYYMNDPEATDAAFRDGWFHPGDIGLRQEDGLLALTGRVSEIINLGGSKLSPAWVEGELQKVADVADVCVLAVPAGEGGAAELGIVVVLRPGGMLANVQQAARALLPQYRRFLLVAVGGIPRNAMGKVARQDFARALLPHIAKARQKAAAPAPAAAGMN